MQGRILDLVGDLRRAEVRVSPSEVLDALTAATEVGFEDRDTFRNALAATLIKEARDLMAFDRLFRLHFVGARPSVALAERSPDAALAHLPRWLRVPDDAAPGASALDPGQEQDTAADGGNVAPGTSGFPPPGGEAGGRVGRAGHGSPPAGGVPAHIFGFAPAMCSAPGSADGRSVPAEGGRGRGVRDARMKSRHAALARKPVWLLTDDEITEMKTVVTHLARRVKDALALRPRNDRQGRLDTRRTMRRSLQYSGVPMELSLTHRRRDRPKLITICDVSDSVRTAARFMLQLVWSLQECFSRVRSFVFVSELAEVTNAFNAYPVEQAIDWALEAAEVDHHCPSDFGHAFSRFVDTQLETLDRRTTILILGDACNNFHDPRPWALQVMRERVKGIVWLNPEEESGWGAGDSVMPAYAPFCDVLRECVTLEQLGRVVEDLVHQWWRRRR